MIKINFENSSIEDRVICEYEEEVEKIHNLLLNLLISRCKFTISLLL